MQPLASPGDGAITAVAAIKPIVILFLIVHPYGVDKLEGLEELQSALRTGSSDRENRDDEDI